MATPAQQHRRGEKRGRGRRPPWPAVVGPWPALACRGLPWPAVARVSWSWPAAAVRLHPQPSSTAGHRLCLHRWIRRSRSLQTRRCRLRTPPADAPLPGPHTPHPPPHRRPPAARPIDPAVAGPDLRPPATVAAGTGHAGRISGAGTAALFTPPPIQGSKGRAAAVLSRLKGFRRPPRAAATVPARPPTRGRRERGGRRLHPRCCYRKIIGVSLSTVMPLTT
jgi:hypothetical protein